MSDSALSKLAKLPNIGGLSGDISLGFAHRTALKIAASVINEISKKEQIQLLLEILEIFKQWKLEKGNPRSASISGLLFNLREQDLTEEDRLEKIVKMEAWECHPYARTPISLFKSLYDYKPIKEYFARNNYEKLRKWDYIIAILIILSDDPESKYQNGDCILAVIELAESRLAEKQVFIEIIKPFAEQSFNARSKSIKTRKANKQLKEKEEDDLVLRAYKELCSNGKHPTAIQQHIIRETGLNQSAVSKSMQRQNLATRKSKKVSA